MSAQKSEEPAPKLPKLEHNYDDSHYAMMKQQQMCDFTVVTKDGKKIPCHRLYLMRSPYFAGMLGSSMMETQKNETREDVDSELFEALLEFLYTNNVKKIEELAERLLVVADRYCCDKLMDKCVSSLTKTMDASNAARYLVSFDMVNCPEFRKKALECITANLDKVMSSEGWHALSQNFELMTELLKLVLNYKKGYVDLLLPHLTAASQMKMGLRSAKKKESEENPDEEYEKIKEEIGSLGDFNTTFTWKIERKKGVYKHVKWSPKFSINIDGQNASFKACAIICRSNFIRIYLQHTGAVLPPPVEVTCTVIQYEAASWRTKLSWNYQENWYPKLVMPDLSGGRISKDSEDFWWENGGPLIKFEFHCNIAHCSPTFASLQNQLLKCALKNKKHCDITITVKGIQFPLHKLVLGEQSEAFCALFEAHPSIQEFNLTNPDVSYKGTLENLISRKNRVSLDVSFDAGNFDNLWNLMYGNDFRANLNLYNLAKEYKLCENLVQEVEDRIIQNLNLLSGDSEACFILKNAHKVGSDKLEKHAFNFIRRNLPAALESPHWATLSDCPSLVTSLLDSILELPDLKSSTSRYKPESQTPAAAEAMKPLKLPCVVPTYSHKPRPSTTAADYCSV